jgi:hypothetical protein
VKKFLWVIGITYAVFVIHLAIVEFTKLTGSRWGMWLLLFSVLDSASIGFTVWKAMKKAEVERQRPLIRDPETKVPSTG